MLEAANVNAAMAVIQLITVQRHSEMLEGALSAFHGTFNRIAVDELPRRQLAHSAGRTMLRALYTAASGMWPRK